jgi:hypothetical protein
MERCCGFTIPECGVFYAFYFEFNLARFDIFHGDSIELDEVWSFDTEKSTLLIDGRTVPFVGLWGGRPLLNHENLGHLSLEGSVVQLQTPNSNTQVWSFANFSGDWESVTFDSVSDAFLFGAPYDFDFRYVELS